jgi:AmmeMemoRadiSam system protein A
MSEEARTEGTDLTPEEGRLLLQLARTGLETYLRLLDQEVARPTEEAVREALRDVAVPDRLEEARGVFVTIRRRNGDLRGCVGYPSGVRPLFLATVECAISAGTRDTRFSPIRSEELAEVELECSVLSPLQAARPEEVVAGRHGVLVSWGGFSGLLLPQVAEEHGWDRETFLTMACRKAGIPEDSRDRIQVETFTAQIFSE